MLLLTMVCFLIQRIIVLAITQVDIFELLNEDRQEEEEECQ